MFKPQRGPAGLVRLDMYNDVCFPELPNPEMNVPWIHFQKLIKQGSPWCKKKRWLWRGHMCEGGKGQHGYTVRTVMGCVRSREASPALLTMVGGTDIADVYLASGEHGECLSSFAVHERLGRLRREWPRKALRHLHTSQVQALALLYLKNCLGDVDPVSRIARFKVALGLATKKTHTPRQCQQSLQRWDRLRRLVANPVDKVFASAEACGCQSLGAFQHQPGVGEWRRQDAVFMVFDDTTLVQRVVHKPWLASCAQLSGLTVLQYALHLSRRRDGGDCVDPVDLTRYALFHGSPEDIWGFVKGTLGVNSRDALRFWTGSSSGDLRYFQVEDRSAAELESCLRTHGPGLLSQVRVTDTLLDGVSFCLTGREGHSLQQWRHTMVLVGVRTSSTGSRFLVQNWWDHKQFVEVDWCYLCHCEAEVTFLLHRDNLSWPEWGTSVAKGGPFVKSSFGALETFGVKERSELLAE